MAGQPGPSSSQTSVVAGSSASQQLRSRKQIVDEWKDQYLIAWTVRNSQAGTEREPTWENKSNVSFELRQEWEFAQSQRAASFALDESEESQLVQTARTRHSTASAQQTQASSSAVTAEQGNGAVHGSGGRRSSGAPSPSTLESLVPDSQAEQHSQPPQAGEGSGEVQMGDQGDEEEEEEPSTQSITMELPPRLEAVAVRCLTTTHPQAPHPQGYSGLMSAITTAQPSTEQSSPQHIGSTTNIPILAPFNRQSVARPVSAAMAAPALLKPSPYRPLSPPCEEELSSQRSSQRSSQDSVGVATMGAMPMSAPRMARPVVRMGLAGPQVVPEGEADADEAETPMESTPQNGVQSGAILVADTPSAPGASVSLAAPAPIAASQAVSDAAGATVVGSTPNGSQSLPASVAPPPAPAPIKRPAEEDDEEVRKKIKPSEPAPPAAVPAVAVVEPEPAPAGPSAPQPVEPAKIPPQTVGLIRLVRESSFVSNADSTKEEIVKFVTDPKAYAATAGGPLLRTPAWAFELRRATYDGIEKHDWILINSTEGTYFLKRTPSTSQVAFANSLDHVPPSRAPSRAGSAQPQPQAKHQPGPAKEATPEPALPPASEMSREQLEGEFAKLQALAAELPALRAASAELGTARLTITSLTRQNKSLQSSKESTQSDFNYMQAQYAEASNAALARARECQLAETQVAELRRKLSIGLAQRDKVMEAIEKRLAADLGKTKGELALLRAEKKRGELVNGTALEKAALWDAHLARQALPRDKDEEEEEEDDSQAAEESKPFTQDERPRLWDPNRDASTVSGSPKPSTLPGSSQAVGGMSLEFVYRCEWKTAGSQPCEHVAASREALNQHVQSHLPPSV